MIKETNTTAVAGFLGVALVLGWAAYRYGMFFDNDFYRLEMFLFFAVMGFVGVRTFIRRKAELPLWTILPLGMAVMYGLELLMGPASVKGTVDAAIRWITYAGWSVLLWSLWRNGSSRLWGWSAVQSAGLLLLAGGWAGWFGWISFPDIVLRFDDAQLSATGVRLAGFMQYPNGYGAVLAAFLLIQLQAWSQGKRGSSLFAAFTIVPYGGALLLTESRGAIAALLLGAAVGYILLDRQARSRMLILSGITALLSALMAQGAWEVMRTGSWNGGLWLAGACAITGTALLILLHLHWPSDWVERKLRPMRILPWFVAGIGTLLAGWIVFGTAGGRVTDHYGTVASRWLFYADAWEMFKDSPLSGYGGESWRMLFGLYQRQPYVGNEVHSGYVEILLDTGLAGLVMLLVILGVYIVKMWRYNRAALPPAVVLLVHAAIDFDWSYGFVWLLMIAWFVLHIAPEEARAVGAAEIAAAGAGGRLRAVARFGRIGLAALLLGSAAVGLWAAWRGDAAASARSAAAAAAAPAARAAQLRAALDANPVWNRIRLELAPLLPARERASMLEAGLRYEPLAPPLWLQLGRAYAELGDVAQARSSLREALRLERFNRDAQTAAIASMANLAEYRREDGDLEQAREAAEAAVSFFERYRALGREVAAMDNPANGKQFELTASAKFNAAQCLLILNRTEEAHALLQELIEQHDEGWKEQAQQLLDNGLN